MKVQRFFLTILLSVLTSFTFMSVAQYRFQVREIDFDKIKRETLD